MRLRTIEESGVFQCWEDPTLLTHTECRDYSGNPFFPLESHKGHATLTMNHDIRIRDML